MHLFIYLQLRREAHTYVSLDDISRVFLVASSIKRQFIAAMQLAL